MSVLSLDDAKDHLNISSSSDDAELYNMIDAAESLISSRIGPLEPVTVSQRVWSNGSSFTLPQTPVVEILSATSVIGQTAYAPDLRADPTSGVVTWYDGRSWFPTGWFDVTYRAGFTTVPPDLLLAVKELLRHLWRTQRGASPLPGSNDSPAPGYLMPYAVEELLTPYMPGPAFA